MTTHPRLQSRHLTMRDGVRIAVDIWLPENLDATQRIPTLMRATRYWRARGMVDRRLEADSNFATAERLNAAGYAYVIVDARGTGASFGVSDRAWAADEVADYGEVVDWIAAQPWSNERVGTFGISYDANTAEMTTVSNPAALKAVCPRFSDFDFFEQLMFPGGVFYDWMTRTWGNATQLMDQNDICALMGVEGEACEELKRAQTGVKPVDEDVDGKLLAAAVREHAENVDIQVLRSMEFKDELFGGVGETLGNTVVPNYRAQIERSGVAYQAWASWLDAGTQLGVLSRFNTFSNPQHVIIGAWTHGAGRLADPFVVRDDAPAADVEEQWGQMLAFFDAHLKEGAPTYSPTHAVTYYTMGSGDWKTSEVWPPADTSMQRWHFAAGGALTEDAPLSDDGADEYAVDFDATTGAPNRWHTQMGGAPVLYPDRAAQTSRLLRYTSAPLEQDLEITGHPLATLFVTSTHDDGAFYVYLDAVDEQGEVTYITEGMLRPLHRKVSDAPPLAAHYGPVRTYERVDALPFVPGQVTELTIELFPTSALIRRGWRIQISIGGHDADSFLRLPAAGTPTISVQRNRAHASWVELPVAATGSD